MDRRAVAKTPSKKVAISSRADSGDRRRRAMLEWMRTRQVPVQGAELAQRFRVSRQCVVQDVAILRAGGQEIFATPQGYRLPAQTSRLFRAILACRHAPERTDEELRI